MSGERNPDEDEEDNELLIVNASTGECRKAQAGCSYV